MGTGGLFCHSGAMPQATVPAKIFLVDDSVLIRERVAELLSAQALDVVGQAHTPEAAIDGILRTRPDVVVLDVQLEGGSGLQVLRAIHAELPNIAFVVFSNNAGPAYRKRYLGEGALRFLDKSNEFDQLAQAVIKAASHAQPLQ
jgi:two-component system response regulator DesR